MRIAVRTGERTVNRRVFADALERGGIDLLSDGLLQFQVPLRQATGTWNDMFWCSPGPPLAAKKSFVRNQFFLLEFICIL